MSGGGWSKLPFDLLHIIEDNILLYHDKVSFSCIFKTWQSVPRLTDLGQPLLVPEFEPYDSTLNFYSIQQNKLYHVDLPEFRENFNVAISDFRSKIYLLNPWKKEEIDLPPLNKVSVGLTPLHPCFLENLAFSSDQNCIALGICGSLQKRLVYCKRGDKEWKILDTSYEDIIFHKRKLYVVTRSEKLLCFDIEHGPTATMIITTTTTRIGIGRNLDVYTSNIVRMNLVEYSGGILLVRKVTKLYGQSGELEITVIRLYLSTKRWRKITNINDDILFLGQYKTKAFTISSHELAGCKRNSIYLSTKVSYGRRTEMECGNYVTDLKNGKVVYQLPNYGNYYGRSFSTIWMIPNCFLPQKNTDI